MFKVYSINKIISNGIMFINRFFNMELYNEGGSTTDNIFKPLTLKQNKVIRFGLDKKKNNRIGSSKKNYRELGVLSVCQLYTKFTISFI